MLSFDLGHWVEPTNTTQFSRFLLIKFDKTSGRKKLYGQNQIVLYCKNTKNHHSKAKHQLGVVFLMCMVPLMAFTFQLLNLFHTLNTNMITKHVGITQLHKVVVHCNIRFVIFFVSFQKMWMIQGCYTHLPLYILYIHSVSLSVCQSVNRGFETHITFNKTVPPNSRAQKLFRASSSHFLLLLLHPFPRSNCRHRWGRYFWDLEGG